MSSLHDVAVRIGRLYFDPHLTQVAEDPDAPAVLVEIDPTLLRRPVELVDLLARLLAEADPYPVRFGFSPPAELASHPLPRAS